jgi:hypothetical protein
VRLAACTVNLDGLQAFAQGIDLAQTLPLDHLRAAAGFAAFFEQRWPQPAEKTIDPPRRGREIRDPAVCFGRLFWPSADGRRMLPALVHHHFHSDSNRLC